MSKRNEGTVKHDRDGKTYMGEWSISKGLITVKMGAISETTQLGGSAGEPETLARLLLSEMVTKHLAKQKR